MSQLNVSWERRKTSGPAAWEYTLVRLDGFIDAPNFMQFENVMEKLLEENHIRIALDFRHVHYINSTGISLIIRFHSALTEKGGCLLLIQVARSVGLTMHLLGLTSVVPFLKSLEEADDYMEGRMFEPSLEAISAEFEEERPKEIPVMVDEEVHPSGSVILAVPRKGPFSKILEHRLRRVDGLNGQYHLVHSVEEITENLDQWNPDLVVLDHRLENVDAFMESLKIESGHSLTSVIMLYEPNTDVDRLTDFRIWENDYLIDPFDLMNLFVLTENELRRVPRDKRLFSQQVHFQFTAQPDNIARAMKLVNRLVHKMNLNENDTNTLYAAVKEGVDNAVIHGNKRDSDLTVTINFLVDPNKITVILEDQGKGFDYEYYLSQIDRQEAFDRAKQRIVKGGRGGLGILIMHKCTDRMEYSGTGNVVRLEKNITR